MTKLTDYLCHRISTIHNTDLYYEYKNTYEKLMKNKEYQNLLIEIEKIDKEFQRERYFEIKQAITNCELEFRHYERELNNYIKHMINSFGRLYDRVNLEK